MTTPTIEVELLSELDLDRDVPCEVHCSAFGVPNDYVCGEPAAYRIKTVCLRGHPRTGFVCEDHYAWFMEGLGKCLVCGTPFVPGLIINL